MRLITPIGPVEVTLAGIERYGPGLLQSFMEENLAEFTVEFGHLDRVRFLVAPVQVASDPVHG